MQASLYTWSSLPKVVTFSAESSCDLAKQYTDPDPVFCIVCKNSDAWALTN
jgi:hypothetical protein